MQLFPLPSTHGYPRKQPLNPGLALVCGSRSLLSFAHASTQITREQKRKGKHHTQKKETFAGAPTLAGAAEVCVSVVKRLNVCARA